MKPEKPEVSRRAFIGSVTAAGAAAVAAGAGGSGLGAQTRPAAQTRTTALRMARSSRPDSSAAAAGVAARPRISSTPAPTCKSSPSPTCSRIA